jgi:Bacterial protein of unknown function (Gcw_chp)
MLKTKSLYLETTKMKKLLASSVIAATAFVGMAAPVIADTSANIGVVSEYYYRGSNLGDAGMYAGADYEASGFYAGVWAIDDGGAGNDGLEYDLYLGYGVDVDGVSLSAGYTLYKYTYTSDSEGEFNLGVGFSGFSLDVAIGEDMNEEGLGAEDYDYEFYSLGWSGEVFGATVGRYENDVDDEYNYVELSASAELSGFDFTASIGTKFDEESGGADVNNNDGYMVLDISKSFDL